MVNNTGKTHSHIIAKGHQLRRPLERQNEEPTWRIAGKYFVTASYHLWRLVIHATTDEQGQRRTLCAKTVHTPWRTMNTMTVIQRQNYTDKVHSIFSWQFPIPPRGLGRQRNITSLCYNICSIFLNTYEGRQKIAKWTDLWLQSSYSF